MAGVGEAPPPAPVEAAGGASSPSGRLGRLQRRTAGAGGHGTASDAGRLSRQPGATRRQHGGRNKTRRACRRGRARTPSSPLSLENRKAGEPLHLRAPGGGGEWGVRQTRRRAKVAGEGPSLAQAGRTDATSSPGSEEGRRTPRVSGATWVQRRASMMQRRDPRRDPMRSPARQVKVSLYFCSVNSRKTASAPYLLISRELEGRCPLSALNSPDTDPRTHGFSSSLSSESSDPPVPPLPRMGWALGTGGPRCGLAELWSHPALPSPTAPPFCPPAASLSARTRALAVSHGGENFTWFGKWLFQLLEAPRDSSHGNTLRTGVLARPWTSRSL